MVHNDDPHITGHRYAVPRSNMRFSLRVALLYCVLSGLAAAQSRAEDQTPESVNYAFSTQLGSGIYTAGGRTIQIYRISLARRFRQADTAAWGLRLVVRTTLGFYDLRVEDILDSGIPKDIGTLAIVPELEFEAPAWRDNWQLLPFVGAGGGKDFQGGHFNYIVATGVRSRLIWPWKTATHIRLGNQLIYSVSTTRGLEFSDDFGLFETVADIRRPLGFAVGRHAMDGGIYGGNYLFLISPKLMDVQDATLQFSTNWEFGVTLGTVEPWRVLGFQLPRIGLGYRFDSENWAIRFLIGETVPIVPPGKRSASIE